MPDGKSDHTGVVTLPDPEPLRLEQATLLEQAKALTVTDVDSHTTAGELGRSIAQARARVVELFKDPKASAFRLHKFVSSMEKALLSTVDAARDEVATKSLKFEAEQRAAADAEAKRQADEAREAQQDALLQEAVEAEQQGDKKLAKRIMSTPIAPGIPMSVQADVAKVKGVGTTTRWGAVVTDKMALIKHVAKHPELVNCLESHMPSLNKMAQAQRKHMNLPGVRAEGKQGKSYSGKA